MKRRWMVVNAVLAGWTASVALALFFTGNPVAGALAVALMLWILLAMDLGRRVNAARADRQLVIDSWKQYTASGLNALERARRIRQHSAHSERPILIHASGRPCTPDMDFATASEGWLESALPSRVTCPLCVSLTVAQS